jgi:hypothetical protein
MQHWLTDEDLASVRDPMALARLPVDEREAWNKLWADVQFLATQTQRVKFDQVVGQCREGSEEQVRVAPFTGLSHDDFSVGTTWPVVRRLLDHLASQRR